MSEKFFYALNFTPKSVSLAAPSGRPHEIVAEVPRGVPNQRQSHLIGQGFTEKAFALDFVRTSSKLVSNATLQWKIWSTEKLMRERLNQKAFPRNLSR